MALPAPLTLEEFLAWEAQQEAKHEYVDGRILAMAGASVAHNVVAMNFALVLGPALKPRGCRPFGSDQLIISPETGMAMYPDVSVFCGPVEVTPIGSGLGAVNPIAIVEVLSPSTERHDRRRKLAGYQAIPTVGEIILASSEDAFVELYRRDVDGWRFSATIGLSGTVSFAGVDIPLAEIYDGAGFAGGESGDA